MMNVLPPWRPTPYTPPTPLLLCGAASRLEDNEEIDIPSENWSEWLAAGAKHFYKRIEYLLALCFGDLTELKVGHKAEQFQSLQQRMALIALTRPGKHSVEVNDLAIDWNFNLITFLDEKSNQVKFEYRGTGPKSVPGLDPSTHSRLIFPNQPDEELDSVRLLLDRNQNIICKTRWSYAPEMGIQTVKQNALKWHAKVQYNRGKFANLDGVDLFQITTADIGSIKWVKLALDHHHRKSGTAHVDSGKPAIKGRPIVEEPVKSATGSDPATLTVRDQPIASFPAFTLIPVPDLPTTGQGFTQPIASKISSRASQRKKFLNFADTTLPPAPVPGEAFVPSPESSIWDTDDVPGVNYRNSVLERGELDSANILLASQIF